MATQARNLQTINFHGSILMEKELLETLLVAQVLTLAQVIETRKNAEGRSSTDHYVGDAIREIRLQRGVILQRLAQTQ